MFPLDWDPDDDDDEPINLFVCTRYRPGRDTKALHKPLHVVYRGSFLSAALRQPAGLLDRRDLWTGLLLVL